MTPKESCATGACNAMEADVCVHVRLVGPSACVQDETPSAIDGICGMAA